MTVRVLIVDDDPLVRAGLTMILQGAPTIEIVTEASNGHEAVAATSTHDLDVVLMDIRMPGLDGLEATEHIMAMKNPPRIIVLTTFDADEYVTRALRVGAAGFLLKDTPPADLVEAIHQVAAGNPMLSPTITAQLIAKVSEDGRRHVEESLAATLTDRERQIAIAIGHGSSNAQIAADLHMSVTTVKTHVSRIFDKLGVNNRVQAAICMHEAGLL